MTRTAVVVEGPFLDRHVGVRNYTFSLAKLLGRWGRADFVTFFRPAVGRPQWYRMALREPGFMADNGVTQDRVYRGRPLDVYRAWVAAQAAAAAGAPPAAAKPDPLIYTHIGDDLGREGYDRAVLSNPWLVTLDGPVGVPAVYGVAYDVIPNQYVFTKPGKPFVLAREHAAGYRYFQDHCRTTFAISPTTRTDLIDYFRFDPARTVALPPLLPVGYFADAGPAVERQNAIVLASPLDRRKGLDIIPALVNPAAAGLEAVYMYGKVRCAPPELDRFFHDLSPDLYMEWYEQATVATVRRLFATARLMVFPSYEEGLGLPLIEAQYSGCRVAARPVEPMRSLMLAGAVPVGPDDAATADLIRAAAADADFPHDELQAAAVAAFRPDNVADVLAAAMDLGHAGVARPA